MAKAWCDLVGETRLNIGTDQPSSGSPWIKLLPVISFPLSFLPWQPLLKPKLNNSQKSETKADVDLILLMDVMDVMGLQLSNEKSKRVC